MGDENPVNAETARHLLGQPGKPWGRTRMSALKRAMGLTTAAEPGGRARGARYFLVSEVRKWLKAHPNWTEAEVYRRTNFSPNTKQIQT